LRGGIVAIGLGLIFIFGTLTIWANGVHEPVYENGVLLGWHIIKPEAIALFAGGAIVGICVFIAGLVATNPDDEAERMRLIRETSKKVQPAQQSQTVIVEPEDESEQLKCMVCRMPLKEDYLMCPWCGTVYKKKCPQCDRIHPSGFKVCPYCGYRFNQPA